MKIFLLGATGNSGGRLLAHALARGHSVTALVRNAAKLHAQIGGITPPGLTIVEAGLDDTAALAKAMTGHDVVINAAATTQLQGENDTSAVDREGTRNLVEAAKRAGVRRIVFITGMSVYSPSPQMPPPMLQPLGGKRSPAESPAAPGLG